MQDRVGQRLGNYSLVRLLGRGGFADVYLGEHLRLNTQAAIKILHTHLDENAIEHFLYEARTIAHLEHPHIVRILDFDVHHGIPFLVMIYAPNGTIRSYHSRGIPLSLSTILPYVKQIAEALQYAHIAKVIHRDVKPENMLIGRHNEVILSDFGIATIVQSTRVSTQNIAGTMAYMAPEQIQAHPRPASDQYSLGVVVYEWLTGFPPFQGTPLEIAAKHLSASPPPLHERVSSIPFVIEEIVLKALAKDPKQRFEHIQAFAEALERASQKTYVSNYESSLVSSNPDKRALVFLTQKDTSQSQDHSVQQQSLEKVAIQSSKETAQSKNHFSRRTVIYAGFAGSTALAGLGLWSMKSLTDIWQNSQGSPSHLTSVHNNIPSPSPTHSPSSPQYQMIVHKKDISINSSIIFSMKNASDRGILIHLPDDQFAAYDRACSHEGIAVRYDPETQMLVCPLHGSIFNPAKGAAVIRGPAPTPLAPIRIVVNEDGTITTKE